MVDYLRLAECFYAFLLPGNWLRADTLYKKYQRMQRKNKDLETVEQHFWWMLIDEGLGEEYRRFLERYLIEFGENWCWEQNIPCSGKPLSSIKWNR